MNDKAIQQSIVTVCTDAIASMHRGRDAVSPREAAAEIIRSLLPFTSMRCEVRGSDLVITVQP